MSTEPTIDYAMVLWIIKDDANPSDALRVFVGQEREVARAEERERIAQAIEAECPGDPMSNKGRPCGPCRNAARIARLAPDTAGGDR